MFRRLILFLVSLFGLGCAPNIADALSLEVNASSIFLGAQAIVIVKRKASEPPADPDVGDRAKLFKISESVNAQGDTQIAYAYFPQTVGTHTIEIRSSSGISLHRVIDVHPLPPQAQRLIPSPRVALSEHFEKDLSPLHVGGILRRVIRLDADSVTAAHLPQLQLPPPSDWDLYPEGEKTWMWVTSSGVHARRESAWRYVPRKAGTLFIPPLRLSFWNTDRHRIESVELPEHQWRIPGTSSHESILAMPDVVLPKVPKNLIEHTRLVSLTGALLFLLVLLGVFFSKFTRVYRMVSVNPEKNPERFRHQILMHSDKEPQTLHAFAQRAPKDFQDFFVKLDAHCFGTGPVPRLSYPQRFKLAWWLLRSKKFFETPCP